MNQQSGYCGIRLHGITSEIGTRCPTRKIQLPQSLIYGNKKVEPHYLIYLQTERCQVIPEYKPRAKLRKIAYVASAGGFMSETLAEPPKMQTDSSSEQSFYIKHSSSW